MPISAFSILHPLTPRLTASHLVVVGAAWVKKAEDAHHEHVEHIKHENDGHLPEPPAYPYLNKRDKPFPWGMNSLFFNPEVCACYLSHIVHSRYLYEDRCRRICRTLGKSSCSYKIHDSIKYIAFACPGVDYLLSRSPAGYYLPLLSYSQDKSYLVERLFLVKVFIVFSLW